MSIIVSIHSFRGGTGKSNLTANLATQVALQGKRVSVGDTDNFIGYRHRVKPINANYYAQFACFEKKDLVL